jgi:hypothetical protein
VTTLCSKPFKIYKKIPADNTQNFEKSIIKNVIVQKLWVMEKFWLHIWIQHETLRYTLNLSCAKILLHSVITKHNFYINDITITFSYLVYVNRWINTKKHKLYLRVQKTQKNPDTCHTQYVRYTKTLCAKFKKINAGLWLVETPIHVRWLHSCHLLWQMRSANLLVHRCRSKHKFSPRPSHLFTRVQNRAPHDEPFVCHPLSLLLQTQVNALAHRNKSYCVR